MSDKKGQGKSQDNFRARRLSVSDIDTSEFDKAKKSNAAASPDASKPGRARRMSMSPEMGVVKPKAQLPFDPQIVGTYSCHGVEPGLRQGETSAKINQDRGCVVCPFGETDLASGDPKGYKQALFCVFDGHGALGDKVSHFAMNEIQLQLEEHPDLHGDPAKALKEIFISVDAKLKADQSIDAELSGTTAVVLLYRQTDSAEKVEIWAACCGDSRAVLSQRDGDSKKWKTTDLTEDQKPDTPAEMARIKSKGGFISPPEEEWGGPARVWLDANMTLPGLAMARSIGDHLVSGIGVYAEPEVTKTEYSTKSFVKNGDPTYPTHVMVMASDGVWEFIESDKAVSLIGKYDHDATVAVTKLIETAAAKWRQEEGDYRDDITAIVVHMDKLFAAATPDAK